MIASRFTSRAWGGASQSSYCVVDPRLEQQGVGDRADLLCLAPCALELLERSLERAPFLLLVKCH